MDMTHINAWDSPPIIALYFIILMVFLGVPLSMSMTKRRRNTIIGLLIGVVVNVWLGWLLKNGVIS